MRRPAQFLGGALIQSDLCHRRLLFFFFSSRRRHTRFKCDWSSDVCSSDLAMRLFHLGRDVAVWGDMTTPAVGPGDLFIASAGPGDLTTARTLVDVAREAGARTALVTAQPGGELARRVDVVTVIPAQTMADDRGGKLSVLPMGS